MIQASNVTLRLGKKALFEKLKLNLQEGTVTG